MLLCCGLIIYSNFMIRNEGTTLTVYSEIRASTQGLHAVANQYMIDPNPETQKQIDDLIGAIWYFNTLLRDGGEFIGYNTSPAVGEAKPIVMKATDLWYQYTLTLEEVRKLSLLINAEVEVQEIPQMTAGFTESMDADSLAGGMDEDFSMDLAASVTPAIPAGDYKELNEEAVKKLKELFKIKNELVQLYQSGYSVYDSIFKKKQNWIMVGILISLSLCMVALVGMYWYVLKRMLIDQLKKISDFTKEVAKGDIAKTLPVHHDNEIGELTESVNQVIARFRESSEFASDIGEGKFKSEFTAASKNDVLGQALLNMRDNLVKVAAEDKKRNWATEGYALFGDILRNNEENLETMSYLIISNLVKYMNANQGCLFVLEDEDNHKSLKIRGCYAYGRRKFINKTLNIGEGLAGQAVIEKDIIYMTDVPEDYIKIKSGLGDATPGCVLISPLIVNEEVFGALEIASFNKFEAHEIEFVKKLSETIAATISSVKVADQTRSLLEESQSMTEQMRAQEEEMRQNMEELTATQEEMSRKQKELIEMQEQMQKQLAQKDELIDKLVTEEPRLKRLLS